MIVSVPLPPGIAKLIQTYVDVMSEDVYKGVCKSFESMNLEEIAMEMVSNFGDLASKCSIQNRCPTRQEIEACAAREIGDLSVFMGIQGETAKKIIVEGASYFFEVYCKNGIPDEKNLIDWLSSIRNYVCTYKPSHPKNNGSLMDHWWVFALLSLLGVLVAFVLMRYN